MASYDDDGPSLGHKLLQKLVSAPPPVSGMKRPRPDGNQSQKPSVVPHRRALATKHTTDKADRSSDDEDSDASDHESASAHSGEDDTTMKQRRKKNAPAEMPTNKPVGRFRQVIPVAKVEFRDPRFESTAGSYNEEFFRNNYKFLSDYKSKEITELKQALRKEKNPDARAEMQVVLRRLQQELAEESRSGAVRDALRQKKKEESELVAKGKMPYFPKKSELKNVAAAAKFLQLEGKGDAAIEKALKKRRKKLASKDRKWLPPPPTRRAAGEEE